MKRCLEVKIMLKGHVILDITRNEDFTKEVDSSYYILPEHEMEEVMIDGKAILLNYDGYNNIVRSLLNKEINKSNEIIKQELVIEYEYIARLDRTVLFTHNPDDLDGKVNIDFLWGPCSKDKILERVEIRD